MKIKMHRNSFTYLWDDSAVTLSCARGTTVLWTVSGADARRQARSLFDLGGAFRKRKLAEFREEIEAFPWESLRAECQGEEGCAFLGTVMALAPSGKCGGFPSFEAREALLDDWFWSVLESVAEEYGLWVSTSEGDPCDVLVGLGDCCDV